MDTVITPSKIKINDDADGGGGCGSSTMVLLQREIDFHKARKPFNGIGIIGGEGFKIETINPTSDLRKQDGKSTAGCSGTKADGFDLELSFGLTFRRIGAGLENLGNTCFLNSVLQCLTYTEPLAAYLQSGKHKNSCHIAGFCALCAIQKHVSRALQLTGRSLAPKDLVTNLRSISRNFRNARQEDAHEYMVNLLESMHKCCLPSGVPTESPGAYEKSLVHKIFGGRLRSQVKCKQCSYCSNKFDPFLDLSLEIFEADSLHKALRNFTAEELLDGGEKQYQCQRCKQKVRALKQLTVDKAPHVLAIHLKRFRAYDGQKIDKKVYFGPTLDMKPFVSGSDGGDLKYTLYGVLVHYGWSNRSGHYSCFVRTASGMWYSLDDNRVGQVNEKSVLNQKAYMLFYVRDRKKLLARKHVDILQKENLKGDVNGKRICSIANQHSKEHAQNGSVENGLWVGNGSLKEISVKDAPLPQNKNRAMAESAMPKEDPNVKPTSGAPLEKIPDSGLLKPLSVPSVNTNSPNHENLTIAADSKINDCEVNGIPKTNLGVSVTPLPIAADSKINDRQVNGIPETNLGVSVTPLTIAADCKINDRQVNETPKSNLGVSVTPSYDGLQNSTGDKPDASMASPKASMLSYNEASRILVSGGVADKTTERLPPNALSVNTAAERLPIELSCEQAQTNADLVKEKVCGIGQNVVLESVALLPSTATTNESLPIKAQNGMSQKKLKKKSSKRRITFTTMHVGLTLFKSSLRSRKKKHKKTKRRTSSTHVNGQLLGECSVSSDLGPSTSEKSVTKSSVSSHSRKKHSKKSGTKSNGGSSMTIVDVDFNRRQNQNGTVLKQCSGSVVETNKQNASEPPKFMDEKLFVKRHNTQGLQETAVSHWDNTEMSSTAEVTKSTSICYVLDEWDEEYDMGKRKKVRQSNPIPTGPNPFQVISTNRSSKFKKAKFERTRYSNQPFRI